jgi:hypothetical protein
MNIYTSFTNLDIDGMLKRAFSTTIPDDPGLRTYFFTNDRYLNDIKDFIYSHIPENNQDKNACALIVGSGAIINFLDIMPKTIIFTDKDKDLLIWIYYLIETLREQENLSRAKVLLGLTDSEDGKEHLPVKLIEHELSSFDNEHYLINQQKYSLARDRISEHNFVFVSMNYMSELDIVTLARLLKINNSYITIANTTNLHPYLSYQQRFSNFDDKLQIQLDSFKELPFDEKAIFITRPLDEKEYYIKPLIGVSAYIQAVSDIIELESKEDASFYSEGENTAA